MNPITGRLTSFSKGDVLPKADRISRGCFFATLGLVLFKSLFTVKLLEDHHWPEALLLLSATAATMTALSRHLPLQNVLLGAAIIGLIGGVTQTIGTLTAIPFGPYLYTTKAGPRLFDPLPWGIPLMWILMVFTSRGVARLILRPWRKMRVYGFWLIGLTALLSLVLDSGLEPFASHDRDYWLWQPTRFPWTWFGTPLIHFLGWLLTTLIILAFATPALIKKKSGPSPPEYFPLIVWVSLSLLFAANAVKIHFWFGAVFGTISTATALVLAMRGAKW